MPLSWCFYAFQDFRQPLSVLSAPGLAPTVLDPVTEYLRSCHILRNLLKFQVSNIKRKCVTDLVALAFFGFLSVPISCYQSLSSNICGPFTSYTTCQSAKASPLIRRQLRIPRPLPFKAPYQFLSLVVTSYHVPSVFPSCPLSLFQI
uniref:Secreted protein n=1 Tax=Haemonchus contortus TaxID=6289 RepID=A0A7I5EES3_HAECO